MSPGPEITNNPVELIRQHVPGGLGSVLLVHCTQIMTNAAQVRQVIGNRFFWAVVKADAYGLGVLPVARALLDAGADGLAVARLGEYQELRDAGITAPVLVLGPMPERVPEDPELHLTITCADELDRARLWTSPTKLQLKVNTGMGRLGLGPEQLQVPDAMADVLRRLSGIWTHYSSADLPGDPTISSQQHLFCQVLDTLRTFLPDDIQVHAANSGGLASLLDVENTVRVGLYLYGANPWTGATAVPLPVHCVDWITRVASPRLLPAGHAVSYRGLYSVSDPGRYGVIPVGYADGLPGQDARQLRVRSGTGYLNLRGRITMDLTVVEMAAEATAGDQPVYLLGPLGDNPLTVNDLARDTGRIEYEVLTSIGRRVPRIYL